MKIGILTYHWVYNMGANLQCLSTYNALKKLGIDPIIINYIPEDNEVLQNKLTSESQIRQHRDFCAKMVCTSICRNSQDIANEIPRLGIEGVIIGSDAVFNLRRPRRSRTTLRIIQPMSDNTFPTPFLGDFLKYLPKPIPIVTLSVSCQNTKPSSFKSQRKEIGDALLHFSAITVRDDNTKRFVEYFTESAISPVVTPDPVFYFNNAVNSIYSRNEILQRFNLPDNYVILSLSEEPLVKFNSLWINQLKSELQNIGLTPVHMDRVFGGKTIDTSAAITRPFSPFEWYYAIKYSNGYIGGLMHPIVTCLHNNVPFYSIDNYGVQNWIGTHKMTTSKTFHIVEKAGMLSNYFHCSAFRRVPVPSQIAAAIKNYDFDRGREFSNAQSKNFEKALKSLIDIIQRNIQI